MRKYLAVLFLCLFLVAGCTTTGFNRNPLKNLTDRQADWFERTSDGWRFEN